jgi:hypothetical protein
MKTGVTQKLQHHYYFRDISSGSMYSWSEYINFAKIKKKWEQIIIGIGISVQ